MRGRSHMTCEPHTLWTMINPNRVFVQGLGPFSFRRSWTPRNDSRRIPCFLQACMSLVWYTVKCMWERWEGITHNNKESVCQWCWPQVENQRMLRLLRTPCRARLLMLKTVTCRPQPDLTITHACFPYSHFLFQIFSSQCFSIQLLDFSFRFSHWCMHVHRVRFKNFKVGSYHFLLSNNPFLYLDMMCDVLRWKLRRITIVTLWIKYSKLLVSKLVCPY